MATARLARPAIHHGGPNANAVATEHGGVPITFVNIDWKRSRHNPRNRGTPLRNLTLLKTTITSIVRNHRPAIICLCEVGECGAGMTDAHMEVLVQTITEAWQNAEAENNVADTERSATKLATAWSSGHPYLTIWDRSQVECFKFRVVKVWLQDPERVAQVFGIKAPGLQADVVNIHSPASAKRALTGPARKGILATLLKCHSAYHSGTIGQGSSILGGDMNTGHDTLSLIMGSLKHLLQSDAKFHFHIPRNAEHGDLAICINVDTLNAFHEAENHDPRHIPVGMRVYPASPAPQEANPEHASAGSGMSYCSVPPGSPLASHTSSIGPDATLPSNQSTATERALVNADARAPERPDKPNAVTEQTSSHQPDGHGLTLKKSRWTRASRTLDWCLSPSDSNEECVAKVRFSSAAAPPARSEEHEHKGTGHLRPSYYQQSAATERARDSHQRDDAEPLQQQDDSETCEDTELAANREKLYCSIAVLLWNANFESPDVEDVLVHVIQEQYIDNHDFIDTLETICHPFFLVQRAQHGSQWDPKDPICIVQKMLWYDGFRQRVLQSRVQPNDTPITEPEVAQCYKDYLLWFAENTLTPEQNPGNIRNMASARMHRDLGNRHAPFAIWEHGMPRLSEPLRTAVLQSELTAVNKRGLQRHIHYIIEWLQRMARSIEDHKNTTKYKDSVRKSGSYKQSGINAAEHDIKERLATLAKDKHRAKVLYDKWDSRSGWSAYGERDAALLWSFWHGELDNGIRAAKRERDALRERMLHQAGE